MLVTRFSSRANLNTFEFTVILVVGATGYLGGIITRSLLQQSHAVRITLRPNSNHSDLIELGAKVAHADLKDPDSLPAACKGIDVVITTANSARRCGSDTVTAVDLNGNRNLINATREAGVRQFIFVSAYEADLSILTSRISIPVRSPVTRSGRCVNAWPTGSLLTGIDLPSRASIIEMMSPQESGSGPPNENFRFNAVALLRAATANAATSAAAINECLRSPLPIKRTGRFS